MAELQAGTDCLVMTTSVTLTSQENMSSSERAESETESSTVGYQVTSSQMTSPGKSNLPIEVIQTMKSLQTLAQDLTGREKDSKVCSEGYMREMYQKLSCFTKIDFVDSVMNYLNSSANSMKLDSWFTKKVTNSLPENRSLPKTCSPLSKCLTVGTREEGDTVVRVFRYKLRINKEGRKLLTKIESAHKKTFDLSLNKCLEKEPEYSKEIKHRNIRTDNFTDLKIKDTELEYLLDVPAKVREYAVQEACVAFNNEVNKLRNITSFRKYKINKDIENLRKKPELKTKKAKENRIARIKELQDKLSKVKEYVPRINFRRKKNIRSSITVPSPYLSVNGKNLKLFPTSCKHGETFNINEKVKDAFLNDKNKPTQYFKITNTPTGRYLVLNLTKEKAPSVKDDGSFVSIDPGIRTFLTCLDSDADVVSYGDNWYSGIKNELDKKDRLQSLIENKEIKINKKASLKERLRRKYSKIKSKIDDMHKKVAKDLLDNYDHILLPKLRTKDLIKQDMPEFNKRMLLISHCRFFDYLTAKGGQRIIQVNESYTTKTCSNCFNQMEVGARKIYTCEAGCGLSTDRDVNASLNILVKNFQSLINKWMDRVSWTPSLPMETCTPGFS